jgi:hypothetical protein
MKKIPLALAFILLSSGLLNAQTKEETITWLKEKLGSYLKGQRYDHDYTNIKLESLDECEFKISYTEKWKENDKSYPYHSYHYTRYYRITAPTSIESLKGDNFYFSTKAVNLYSKGGDILEYLTDGGSLITTYKLVEINEFQKYISLQIEEREVGIRERVEKAFNHLATFCPKKKEVF